MTTMFTIGKGAGAFVFLVDSDGWIAAGGQADGSVPVIVGQTDLHSVSGDPTAWGEVEEATGNNATISDGISLYPTAQFDDALVEGQVQDILWALAGLAGGGGRLLDLGCGPGYLLAELSRRLPGWKVQGLDPSPDSVRQARAAGLDVRLGTMDTIDYSGPYDAIVIMGNFQLHHDPAGTLRGLATITRPGARMFLDSKNPRTSARLLARALLTMRVTKRLDVCHHLAAHAFHGMRHGIPKKSLSNLLNTTGWTIQELRTTEPRLLRFRNEHQLAHGSAGMVWRIMDVVDTLRSERAWIQVAAQRR